MGPPRIRPGLWRRADGGPRATAASDASLLRPERSRHPRRTAMTILLGLLVTLGALLTAFVGATAFSLRSSDAAGNGLAEAFFAFAVLGLWLLIGVALLIAGTRPPRLQQSWGTINLVSVVLFFGVAAGMVGALQVLSGHRSEGLYRLLVQVAVVAAPIAALLHVAWRGLGTPLPAGLATRGVALIVVLAALTPVWGMVRPRRAAAAAQVDPLEQLAYPAIVIHNLSRVVVADSAADLRTMHTNHVVLATSEPFLIDASLQIYVVRDLRLTKGAGGLMIRGQGVEPVSFKLVDWEPDGTPDAVRNILLRVSTFGPDPDKDASIRQRLATEETLEGMIGVIREP
jgi:hypothetical protein